jgi:membrane associated rhomboid family serine protease
MKAWTNLILESACVVLFFPVLGFMLVGLSLMLLFPPIMLIVMIAGKITSVFFKVDWQSGGNIFDTLMSAVEWIAGIVGPIGGLVAAYLDILERWREFSKR